MTTMFWYQIAQQMTQLNFSCRQNAVAIISGTFCDNGQTFYDGVVQLSDEKLNAFLSKLTIEDRFCHTLDDVSCCSSGCLFDSPSVPSG
jgi:hypothetical protein